jgi:hypothetical protein
VPATLFGLVILIWVIPVPEHTVWVLGAAATVGTGLTVTLTVPGKLRQPVLLFEIVTEYVPVAAVVAFVIDGVLLDDVKPLGPDQE